MKKYILTINIVGLILFSSYAKAEDENFETKTYNPYSFGATIDMDISSETMDERDGNDIGLAQKPKKSAGISTFFGYRISTSFGIDLDTGYNKRGIKGTMNRSRFDVDLHCFDFGIFPVWLLCDGDLHLFLGPKLYYLIGADTYIGTKKQYDPDNEFKGSFRSLNFGLALGIRYEIAKSGCVIGFTSDAFFYDMDTDLGDNNLGLKYLTAAGAKLYIGYNFGRLLD